MKKIISFMILIAFVSTANAQAVNDEPCNAIVIPVESTGCEPSVIYAYALATHNATYGNTYCNGSANRDVWYKCTVPASGSLTVAVANSTSPNMAVEMLNSTSCTALSLFNYSTNGFQCLYSNSSDKITYQNLTPGNTVYLRVYALYDINIASGNLKICISNPSSLSDEPCNAGFFDPENADPLSQNCVPYKQFSWTGATLTPAIPNPSCIYSGYYALVRDVWFKVRVPATGKLKINMTDCGYLMGVYTATACNGTFTEIGCVNCVSPGVYYSLVPNSIIYCRVFHNSSAAVADGIVKICVAAGNTVPAVNNFTKIGIGIDTPFAKLDVVGTGIFRDKLTAGTDMEVRGNLIIQGNIIGKYGDAVLQGNTTVQGGPLKIDSLDIGSRLGNRIALYGGLGNTGKYGFGIQSSLLQMYSDAAASNIAFGYGNSYNFFERAKIINQGEIGMTLNGRLQLKTGTQSAGLWLNNMANTATTAFIGLASDNQVGLYSPTGAAWGLTMNTTTGNVGIGLNGAAAAKPLSFPASIGEKILLFPGINGEVGIGVYGNELRLHSDNPGAKVSFGTQDNAGTYTENALAQRNGVYAFSVLGSIWANGTTYASDERFKQNITPINSPLQRLLQLKGVEYEMKTKEFSKNNFAPGRQMGLLAQNVETVAPEAVNEKDGYKGVDYARLVPLLIEAIKEQDKKIEDLQQQINTLKKAN
jgi:hypothetical protein